MVSRPHTDKKGEIQLPQRLSIFPRGFSFLLLLPLFIYVVFQTQKQLFTNTTSRHTLHTIFAFSYLTWKGSQQQQSERFSYYYNFPSFFFSRLCLTHMLANDFFWSWKNAFWWGKKKWCGSFLFNATQTLVGLLYVFIPKKKSYVATKEIPCHWIYTSQSYCVYERERKRQKTHSSAGRFISWVEMKNFRQSI